MVWSAVLAGGTLVFVGVHTVGGLLLGARAIRARDPSPRLNALIGRCADEMRLLSTPSVAISDSCRSPYVTLYAGGTIVLPPEFEGYGHSVQRGVLMHEMAHLRRGDCLTQLLVQLAGAALWWNPLYWVAMRRIALERELACDAAVLNEHHDPAWYADLLVRLARAGRSIATVAFAATPMAQSSTLTLRLRALRQISGRFTPMDAVLSPMSRMEMLCWVVGLFCFITVCEALGRVMIEELSRDPRFFASVSMFFGG
jgi:beta-lactamase regulating signal transducer with metallopeptidase domain